MPSLSVRHLHSSLASLFETAGSLEFHIHNEFSLTSLLEQSTLLLSRVTQLVISDRTVELKFIKLLPNLRTLQAHQHSFFLHDFEAPPLLE